MDDLLTDRLAIHPLTADEAGRIAAADRGPDTHWAPDYPADGERAGARMFLRACAAVGDPQPFGCYEIRLRADGTAIGGIGFHGAPDEQGAVEVGYGLAASARGHGYAAEALRAVICLARAHGATRVTGNTTHDNLPSQRVMAAAGMAFTREDAVLRHYGTAAVPRPRLAVITPANVEAAIALKVRPDQEHLVEPVAESLALAYAHGDTAWPRLILDGDRPVGFLMAFLDIDFRGDGTRTDVRSGLWRLNIAAADQGRGHGRFAVESVAAEIRRRGGTRLTTTWHPGEDGPGRFYLGLGFRPTGELSGGQTVGELQL